MSLIYVIHRDGQWHKVDTIKHISKDTYRVYLDGEERGYPYKGEDIEQWELSDWLIKELEQNMKVYKPTIEKLPEGGIKITWDVA